MAEGNKLSVEEILAKCRTMDAARKTRAAQEQPSGAVPPAPPAAGPGVVESQPQVSGPTGPTSRSPTAPEPKPARTGAQMTVEEVLAAARRKPGAAPAGASAALGEEAAPAASGARPAAPAAGKGAAQMSVAEVLAAARAGAKGPAAAPARAATPAAEPAAEKTPAQEATTTAKRTAIPADTASILAAARVAAKPGPISKAEAAARARPLAPPPAKPKVPTLPERPAYLRPTPAEPAPERPTRRGFFSTMIGVVFGSSLAIGFSSLFVTNLLWLLGLARFMFPNILTEPPTVFKVGYPDDYAPGQVETRFVAQFGVWIVRYEYQGQPQIYALRTVCTHLGCTPNWLEAEQKFKCPCHGSGFYKDGINFEGPAPRPLERYAIRVAEDGQLEVDKSRRFQEELGQWKDPASFVPV